MWFDSKEYLVLNSWNRRYLFLSCIRKDYIEA